MEFTSKKLFPPAPPAAPRHGVATAATAGRPATPLMVALKDLLRQPKWLQFAWVALKTRNPQFKIKKKIMCFSDLKWRSKIILGYPQFWDKPISKVSTGEVQEFANHNCRLEPLNMTWWKTQTFKDVSLKEQNDLFGTRMQLKPQTYTFNKAISSSYYGNHQTSR